MHGHEVEVIKSTLLLVFFSGWHAMHTHWNLDVREKLNEKRANLIQFHIMERFDFSSSPALYAYVRNLFFCVFNPLA